MSINRVTNKPELLALVELLRNENRLKPVCVISIPANASSPAFDLVELGRQAGDLAFIYEVPTGEFTWELAEVLGSKGSVFNGAAKVFSGDWYTDEEWPRLFYCLEKFQDRDTQALIDHIWKFASDIVRVNPCGKGPIA